MYDNDIQRQIQDFQSNAENLAAREAYDRNMREARLFAQQQAAQQAQDDSWGITRGFLSGGAGAFRDQAQLANLMGAGDGATANYFNDVAQRNNRRKQYTIGDMIPFASDYWTNGEGAAYDIGNMLGSSAVFGAEAAALAATGGAALGALGVGSAGAAGAAAAARGAGLAGRAFAGARAGASISEGAVANLAGKMAAAAERGGYPKLAGALSGRMGQLYALNILKTPIEVSSEMGSAGAEALENGADLDEARKQAMVVGALQMPLLAFSNTIESAGLGGLLTKKAGEKVAKQTGREGLMAVLGSVTREGLQNAWEEGMQQSTHDYAQGNQSLLGVVNPAQWNDEALQQAAVGAVGGLAIGGGNAAMRAGANALDGREAARQEAAAQEAAQAQQEAINPAVQAQEYLDGLYESGSLPDEQKAEIGLAADSDDSNVILRTAIKYGWENPAAQQEEVQAQPVVTAQSSTDEQLTAANEAVNAAVDNVANGGAVVGNMNANGEAAQVDNGVAAEQAVTADNAAVQQQENEQLQQSQEQVAAAEGQTATPIDLQTARNKIMELAARIQKKGSKKERSFVSAGGSVDIAAIRKDTELRRNINNIPDIVVLAKEALSGNAKAAAELGKYRASQQIAAIDAAVNGVENWQFDDVEKAELQAGADRTLRNQAVAAANKLKLWQTKKANGKAPTKAEAKEMAEAVASNDIVRIVDVASKYGYKVPQALKKHYDDVKQRGVTSILKRPNPTKNTMQTAPLQEQAEEIGNVNTESTEATEAAQELPTINLHGEKVKPQLIDGGKRISFKCKAFGKKASKAEKEDYKVAGFRWDSKLQAHVAGNTEAARAFLNEYNDQKAAAINVNSNVVVSTNTNAKINATINGSKKVSTKKEVGNKSENTKKNIGNTKNSAEQGKNERVESEANAADNQNSSNGNKESDSKTNTDSKREEVGKGTEDISDDNQSPKFPLNNKLGDWVIDTEASDSDILIYKPTNENSKLGWAKIYVDKDGDGFDIVFHDKRGWLIENHDYWCDTADEAEEFLKYFDEDSLEVAENENTQKQRSQRSEQDSVQHGQSEEIEQSKTADDQDEGTDGKTKEVETQNKEENKAAPKEDTVGAEADKKTEAPTSAETATVDNVAEKYPSDSRGILKDIAKVEKQDRTAAKEYNSKHLKEIIDGILRKCENGEISLEEARVQIKKINSAYTKDSPFALLPADDKHSDDYRIKDYMRESVAELDKKIKAQAEKLQQERATAIEEAGKEARNIVEKFKGDDNVTLQQVQDELKAVKEKLEAKLNELGAKPLGTNERKNVYDSQLSTANKIQTTRDAKVQTQRQKAIRDKAKAEAKAAAKAENLKKEDNKEQGSKTQEAAPQKDVQEDAKQKVKKAVAEVLKMAKDADYRDKETGKVDQSKKNEYDDRIAELLTPTSKLPKALADVLEKLKTLEGKLRNAAFYEHADSRTELEKAALKLAPTRLSNEELSPIIIDLDALGLELDEQAKEDIADNEVVQTVLGSVWDEDGGEAVQALLDDLEGSESFEVCKTVAEKLQEVLKKRAAIYDRFYAPIDTAKENLNGAMVNAGLEPPKSLSLVQLLAKRDVIKEEPARSDVEEFVDKALKGVGENSILIRHLSDNEVLAIKKATNIDVRGYSHVMDANGIRHSWNNHGGKNETRANHIGLEKEDYYNYVEVLDNPTIIKKGNASQRGEFTVRYEKNFGDGTVYIIEFISAADKTLRTKIMWKEQSLGGGGSANKSNSSHTSKTGTNAIVPSTGRSISQTKRIGQELINLIQNTGIEVITDKAEIKRVLGESLDKAAKDDAVQKLIISYEEGEQAPDLTITKQSINGKDMYGVAFVGEKPKNYVPKKIGKAYKLMELYPDGTLHALFAGTEKAHKLGEWTWAQGFTPDEKGAMKEMKLAPRYGWHMGTGVPASYHLMGVGDTLSPQMTYPTKKGIGHPKESKRVWVEVHYDATNDYTDIAERNPGREKDIRGLIPFGGYYMFQEGNLSNWIIASGIKFDHVLSETERNRLLKDAGYNEELVWRKQVLVGKLKAQITSDNKKISGEKKLSKNETLESVKEHKREIEKLIADNEARIKELNDGKNWEYKKRSEADLAAERARIRKEVFDNPETQDKQFLKTSSGDVYGFVKDGKIYVDPDLLDANTPIHEYTHVWDNTVRQRNPELWARGVELLKQTDLWEEVANDPLYADIKGDENLLASEVHARLVGSKGEAVLEKVKAPKGVLGALKKWLNDFWTFLKDTFTKWSGDELARLSLADFVAMPIGDLVKGTKLGAETTRRQNPTQYSIRQKSTAQDPGITGINNQYKKELEEAYSNNANNNQLAAIMNAHQQALAEYLKSKGEAQKERSKIRAAELRQARKDFAEGKIDSYTVGGVTITRNENGAEVVKDVSEKLPSRKYTNERHVNQKPANATQKLGSIIARPEEKSTKQKAKDWIGGLKDSFYKQWVDKYDALNILDGAIADANGEPINPADTILGRTQMITNAASGAARALIDGDPEMLKQLADRYKIKNMVSLQMLMEKIGAARDAGKFADYVKSSNADGSTSLQSYIDAVENYLVARSAIESAQNHRLDYDKQVAEWQENGGRGKKPEFKEYKFPGGMTEAEVMSVIRSAPAEFKEYAKMFKGVTDNMLDILYNSGLITGERYLAIKDRYKAYCPLMRDFSDTAAVDSFIDQINGGRGIGNVSDPLKTRSSEGSERDIVPPLATIIKSINALTMKAERNRVGQYAVRQAKKHKLNDFIKEVEGSSGDAKNCIFTVVINGKKRSFQTTPELYPAITAAVEPLLKVEMALLTKPAQLLRTGSTMSPSFIIRNFLRDTLFAAVATKNGFVPIYDSIRGAYALLHNKQLRGEFMSSGVVSSNFYGDGESIMRSLNDMAGGKKWEELTPWEIVKAIISKPIKGLEWTSNLIEQSTRMGEFMRAREKGKSIDQAAYDAVEITLNFNRSGATGQQVNRAVPFFNACIQGGDKLYRLFKADPKTTLLRIGVYMVLPSLVLWLMNHDEDWYKDLDPNIKMQNWILPGGIRIPKPQEAGVLFGSGFEAVLDTANGQDPKAMKTWSKTVLDNLAPGIFPTLILPLLEWQANYSFFRGKPVVSKSQERLPDELQYGPYTSEASKAIGSVSGLSPVKLDNLWRGYTGTMGMALWQAPDLLVAEKRNLPEKKLSEMAVVRDFVINDMNMNRTTNDFYALSQAATQWQAGYGKKGKPTVEVSGINTAARTIAKLQKEARDITGSPKYNSAQKRVLIDKLQAKQKKIAELCIKKYGKKFDY